MSSELTADFSRTDISVIVCTRNRKDNILPTVRALQNSTETRFELIIIDQSDNTRTQEALKPLCEDDPRIRYFHMDAAGKPLALAYAFEQAQGRFLLFTDDDCEPATTWISAMVDALNKGPEVGLAFGSVVADRAASDEGYIPDCIQNSADLITKVNDYLRLPGPTNLGIGANMGARAEVLKEIGGWDPCIGPGSAVSSGDDQDLAIRVLAFGYHIALVPESEVVHFGFRYWRQMQGDMQRYGRATGAIYAKFLRCGVHYTGARRMFLGNLCFGCRKLLSLKRPQGFAYSLSWLRGFFEGLRRPISRRSLMFAKAGNAAAPKNANTYAAVLLRSEQKEEVGSSR